MILHFKQCERLDLQSSFRFSNRRFHSSFAARKRQIGLFLFFDPGHDLLIALLHPTRSISPFWLRVEVQIEPVPEMIRQVGLLAGSFLLLLVRNVLAQGESVMSETELSECPEYESLFKLTAFKQLNLNTGGVEHSFNLFSNKLCLKHFRQAQACQFSAKTF